MKHIINICGFSFISICTDSSLSQVRLALDRFLCCTHQAREGDIGIQKNLFSFFQYSKAYKDRHYKYQRSEKKTFLFIARSLCFGSCALTMINILQYQQTYIFRQQWR